MKKICFIVSVLLCFLLCSCGSSTPKSAELSEKYDFYKSSISGLKTATGVTAEEADELFIILASDCGVDSFFTVTKNASGDFYNVNYGMNTLKMYLDGSVVSEVFNGEDKIFPEVVLHNFLLDISPTVKDVLSGSGDVLGQYAFVRITNEQLENITPEMLKEFSDNIVKNSGYNWVSIVTPSDNGICFTGSDTSSAFYGKLDKDGSILDAEGMWVCDENGNYTYTESE